VPYLIDGNNLLGSWGGLRPGEDRRHEVVRRVAAFCRARGARAILVFDGEPLRAERPSQEMGAVSIRVPRPGEDADTVIRGLVDAARSARDLLVVTSDKPLYSYARTRGARVLRAHEWNALERTLPRAAPGTAPGSRRGSAPAGAEKPEREDDVEGWLDRFSRRS
jgi:predicted RNA-binding protein with PIN domain